MPFLEECAIFGGMYNFLRNVIFLEEFDIFGGMHHFWMNLPFLDDGGFLEECAICG